MCFVGVDVRCNLVLVLYDTILHDICYSLLGADVERLEKETAGPLLLSLDAVIACLVPAHLCDCEGHRVAALWETRKVRWISSGGRWVRAGGWHARALPTNERGERGLVVVDHEREHDHHLGFPSREAAEEDPQPHDPLLGSCNTDDVQTFLLLALWGARGRRGRGGAEGSRRRGPQQEKREHEGKKGRKEGKKKRKQEK